MQPEMFPELATAVFIIQEGEEHESEIGSRVTIIHLSHQKGDVFQLSIIENRKYQRGYC